MVSEIHSNRKQSLCNIEIDFLTRKGIFNFMNKNTEEGRWNPKQMAAYTCSSCTSNFIGSTPGCRHCQRLVWKLFFLHVVCGAILAKFGKVLLLKIVASLLALGCSKDVMLMDCCSHFASMRLLQSKSRRPVRAECKDAFELLI